MEKKASRVDVVEKERKAWADVLKRLDFFSEMACARTDKLLVQDAFRKLSATLDDYYPLYKQRMVAEFPKA
jgi:hypothetical protein